MATAGHRKLQFEPILWSLFGAQTCIWTFIPRWTPLFDSHEKLGLPLVDSLEPEPIPPGAEKLFAYRDKKHKRKKYYDVFEEDFVEEEE